MQVHPEPAMDFLFLKKCVKSGQKSWKNVKKQEKKLEKCAKINLKSWKADRKNDTLHHDSSADAFMMRKTVKRCAYSYKCIV